MPVAGGQSVMLVLSEAGLDSGLAVVGQQCCSSPLGWMTGSGTCLWGGRRKGLIRKRRLSTGPHGQASGSRVLAEGAWGAPRGARQAGSPDSDRCLPPFPWPG